MYGPPDPPRRSWWMDLSRDDLNREAQQRLDAGRLDAKLDPRADLWRDGWEPRGYRQSIMIRDVLV